MNPRMILVFSALISVGVSLADGPQDNLPDKVRPVPPPGVAVPETDRKELEAALTRLEQAVAGLKVALKGKPELLDLLPDVQVYHKAVRDALKHNEFFKPAEIGVAKMLLKQGQERAEELAAGKASWRTATGLVVRGYVSKIDGSVQPYGLVVPASYQPDAGRRHRLDVWCHGRGETLSEVNFIDQRQRLPGEFTPRDAFVLHLYGRYCCANKFAGEIDCFEARAHASKHYPIDEDRLVMRGFSMGGAACWQFAVHYPDVWCAAAPGAGFSETAEFLRVFQNEAVKPTWYEQKLWHWYDCTDYALNLFNLPTIAYSGEDDRQKQAADVMARAMRGVGLELKHVIGPKTGHKYHPDSKNEINAFVDDAAARGRNPWPTKLKFVTYTLRYSRMGWLTVEGLDRHWEPAKVEAEVVGDEMRVTTAGVTRLTLRSPAQKTPGFPEIVQVVLDGQRLGAMQGTVVGTQSGRAVAQTRLDVYEKEAGKWQSKLRDRSSPGLRKRPGLQGPIDDAFLDSFLMVKPTGKPLGEKVGAWTQTEMAHAVDHWRKQFRGDARVKADSQVTPEEIANHNLVLWGDPQSNQLLARILPQLPIRWDVSGVQVGTRTYAAGEHVPVLIYPNPLNPDRYVVVNSGFTFREYDYLNNARQVPKLPDYAVVDIRVPVSSRAPGGIVTAGFFDERWQLNEK